MRSFLTYGLFSLVGIASLYACGDDSGDDDGRAGAGGSTPTAGAGGTGGATGGNGGTGGATGGAPNGGAAGSGPPPAVPTANCTGCVQLSVLVPATPVTATGSQAGYIFVAPATAAPFDLTNVTSITWRVQALTPGATYFVQPFVQNAPPEDPMYAYGSYAAAVPLAPATFSAGAWVDVVFDVAALPGPGGVGDAGVDAGDPVVDAGADGGVVTLTGFDKSKARQIGLNVGAGATGPAGWVSVEVDSVTVAGGASNFTTKNFATDVEGLTLNMFQVPPGTLPPTFR